MASFHGALGQPRPPWSTACSPSPLLVGCGSRFEFTRLHRPDERGSPAGLLRMDSAGVAARRRACPRIEATSRHGARTENAKVRNRRLQKKFNGTATKPRLSVFCSNRQLYAVLADDHNKKILFYGSTLQKSICGDPPCTTVEAARRVGEELIRVCTELSITEVSSYDRNGFARGEKMMAFEVPISQHGFLPR